MENLKLKNPYMHGSNVRRLQEVGDLLGYDYGPNDGIFGEDTERVVKDFQRHNGLVVDGICGEKTWSAMLNLVDAAFVKQPLSFSKYPLIRDIRGKHPRPKNYAYQREWSDIVGVTLHQTGCGMPKRPMGWSKVNAHIGVTQEGLVVIMNDPVDMIWHAQGLSRKTIGIEIEGNFYGVEGAERTLWSGGGGPYDLNPMMISALNEVKNWLIEEFSQRNVPWTRIYAHRQSSPTRRGDPGSLIWNEVALSWAEDLKLGDSRDGGHYFKLGKGRPIPMLWDANRIIKY